MAQGTSFVIGGLQVGDIVIDEYVSISTTLLQPRLSACDVFIQVAEIAPPRIVWFKVRSSVEHPSRPFCSHGRETGAMIEDVVHTSEEEKVDGLLGIAQSAEEMLVEPRATLAADETLAREMCSRWSCLNADEVTPFDFGHVRNCIKVQDVGWRTMCLIAYSLTVFLGPLAPRHSVFLEDECLDNLSKVIGHAVVHLGRILSQKGRQMLAQVITHALLELVEHLCRPVAHAARIIHLVRIVEIIAQIADVTPLEGLVEFREES